MFELNKLIGDSVALIPVGANKRPKTEWQNQPKLGIFELKDLMRHFSTQSVAMRCGGVSDGLVCIDIDTKHYAGIDAKIFLEIRELYGEIWEKLRIERTPSGGYHILYRYAGLFNGFNEVFRNATKEEIEANPKLKKVLFVEVKGEGCLAQCFPSTGYTVEKFAGGYGVRLIKFLTIEEHASLLNLIRSFNEYFEPEKEKKIGGSGDIYDESPFKHFNRSTEGDSVLEDLGWLKRREHGSKRYFSKPNRKGKDIDASFDVVTRMYKIWTTETIFEARGWSPSALLGWEKFGGDGKQMSAWLVARGYGRLKKNIEDSIIKREARKKSPVLPANISEEGVAKFEVEVSVLKEKYPYGVFWKINDEGIYKISRERFLRVSEDLGFRRHKHETVYIDDYVVRYVSSDFFFERMKSYIKEESDDLFDVYEQFLQSSGEWTRLRFKEIDLSLILKSTAELSFKFFRNCYIEISKEGEERLEYAALEKLVWEDKIKDRDYTKRDDWNLGLYYDFLNKAVGVDSYLMQIIGYYAHEFRDERGYMAIATESCENPKDGGGSGKNIFWSLLGLTTTFKSLPASQATLSKDLFQSWDKQRIFAVSDMEKDFNLIFLKDIITGNSVVNKKFINEFEVPVEDMPKLAGSSNFSFDTVSDGGLKRRIRHIEFTDFFTRARGVDKYYKKMFPKDWEDCEYLWFDNFISECIREFLLCDYEITNKELSIGGWIKQFEARFRDSWGFFEEHFPEWIKSGRVHTHKYKQYYDLYCSSNNLKYPLKIIKLNEALKEYAAHMGYDIIDREISDGGVTARGKEFVAKVGTIIPSIDEQEEPPF